MKESRYNRDGVDILNLETGVFYKSAREAYNSININISERSFSGLLREEGNKNSTNFIKL